MSTDEAKPELGSTPPPPLSRILSRPRAHEREHRLHRPSVRARHRVAVAVLDDGARERQPSVGLLQPADHRLAQVGVGLVRVEAVHRRPRHLHVARHARRRLDGRKVDGPPRAHERRDAGALTEPDDALVPSLRRGRLQAGQRLFEAVEARLPRAVVGGS